MCDVSAGFLQHFAQGTAFKAMDGGLERIVCRRCGQLHVDVCWQILRGDRGRGDRQDIHGMFDGVLQLPHIAGPVIGLEDLQRGGVDKTTPRLIQFHTLKNAVNPPFLGGFSIFGTVAAQAEQRSCQGDSLFSMILCNDRKAIVTE